MGSRGILRAINFPKVTAPFGLLPTRGLVYALKELAGFGYQLITLEAVMDCGTG